ncbi:hypothetical protein BU17DRAFT_81467 [Hysterangium stoloniferum]|nr:hypothetical protein BU17DRAFT_81467 [Hysterangium stoloniferum]
MGSQWDSLVADNVAHLGCSSAHISNGTSPSSLVTLPKFLPIMEEEKAALTAI